MTLRDAAARIVEQDGGTDVLHGAGHGDFSPWNVCAHDGHLTVWDWERFALDVPVGWDEIHFTLNAYPGGAAAALTTNGLQLSRVLHDRVGSSGRLLTAAYLLNRGVNYLVDRQLEAGARHGPLSDWLLPALDTLLSSDGAR